MAALATPTELRLFTGEAIPDDARANLLLEAASAAVRNRLGWHLAPMETDAEVTVDGSGARVQPLPTRRLVAVTAISEAGTAVDTTTVDYSETGILWRATPWTRRLRGLVVTMTHGYAECPPEVKAVVLTAAARGLASPVPVTQRSIGQYSESFGSQAASSTRLAELELAILDRYRVF